MNTLKSEYILASLIKDAVESEGCYITGVDFEELSIEVDGPDEVIHDCARAVEKII